MTLGLEEYKTALTDFRDFQEQLICSKDALESVKSQVIHHEGEEYRLKVEKDKIVIYNEDVEYKYSVMVQNRSGDGLDIIRFIAICDTPNGISNTLAIFVCSFFQRLIVSTFFMRMQDSTIDDFARALSSPRIEHD